MTGEATNEIQDKQIDLEKAQSTGKPDIPDVFEKSDEILAAK